MNKELRKTILQTIFDHFQMVSQDPLDTESFYKAVGLIELLEVEDCGSVGGFDRENPMQHVTGFDAYDRFLTLLRKENIKLEKELYFTPETLGKYFTQLYELREKFNK